MSPTNPNLGNFQAPGKQPTPPQPTAKVEDFANFFGTNQNKPGIQPVPVPVSPVNVNQGQNKQPVVNNQIPPPKTDFTNFFGTNNTPNQPVPPQKPV